MVNICIVQLEINLPINLIVQKACCCEGVAQQCFMFSFIQNPEVVTSSSGFIFGFGPLKTALRLSPSPIFETNEIKS